MQSQSGKGFYNLNVISTKSFSWIYFLKHKSGNSASVCLSMLNPKEEIFISVLTLDYAFTCFWVNVMVMEKQTNKKSFSPKSETQLLENTSMLWSLRKVCNRAVNKYKSKVKQLLQLESSTCGDGRLIYWKFYPGLYSAGAHNYNRENYRRNEWNGLASGRQIKTAALTFKSAVTVWAGVHLNTRSLKRLTIFKTCM